MNAGIQEQSVWLSGDFNGTFCGFAVKCLNGDISGTSLHCLNGAGAGSSSSNGSDGTVAGSKCTVVRSTGSDGSVELISLTNLEGQGGGGNADAGSSSLSHELVLQKKTQKQKNELISFIKERDTAVSGSVPFLKNHGLILRFLKKTEDEISISLGKR